MNESDFVRRITAANITRQIWKYFNISMTISIRKKEETYTHIAISYTWRQLRLLAKTTFQHYWEHDCPFSPLNYSVGTFDQTFWTFLIIHWFVNEWTSHVSDKQELEKTFSITFHFSLTFVISPAFQLHRSLQPTNEIFIKNTSNVSRNGKDLHSK